MSLQTLIKQPAESRIYSMNFAANLGSATIASVVSIASSGSGLTIGASSISGTRVYFRISAGTNLVTYKITVRITDSAGNTLDGEGWLKIEDL